MPIWLIPAFLGTALLYASVGFGGGSTYNALLALAGQLGKLGSTGALPEVAGYWPLALAVVIGGQIGSIAGIRLLSPTLVRRATGLLILYVAALLAWRLLTR